MSRDICHKKCMGRGQPRDCAMKKWRLFDRWTAMVPLVQAESWPFLRLFEHGVRNLCTCERLRTIAAAFYLSFLLFSVVVVGVSCLQL